MKQSFETARLIISYMEGRISEEEAVRLDRWIEKSKENKELFVSLMDGEVFRKEKEKRNQEELDRIFSEIRKRKESRCRLRRRQRLMSAAAVLALMLGTFFFLHLKDWGIPAGNDGSLMAAGENKAVLHLSSGERIELEGNLKDTIALQEEDCRLLLDGGKMEIACGRNAGEGKDVFHTIEIPNGTDYRMDLSDGTTVWLNAGSRLRFPAAFAGKRRYVELSGEACFKVMPDASRPFIVRSAQSEVKVTGTEFCIRSYKDGPSLTTLVSGHVEVTDNSGKKMRLEPGQQSFTEHGRSAVRNVDPYYYTAWRDGYFVFKETALQDIMEQLSRWYGFSFFFADSDCTGLRLTARVKKYSEIDVILDLLSRTGEVRFEKKGNTILIYGKN